MKKIPAVVVCALLAACGSNTSTPVTDAAKPNPDSAAAITPIRSPYPIDYSSNFTMDDPKNAESLLAIWKAYDNGDLSASREFFADTVEAELAEGAHMRASRDSMLAGIQSFRNTFKTAFDRVSAIMAVKNR